MGMEQDVQRIWLMAFESKLHNNIYTEEYKKSVVKEYLDGLGSLTDLQVKYNIPQHETIRQWVIKYTKGEEIRDYLPRRRYIK